MEELYKSLIIVCGSLGGVIAFIFLLVKVIKPLLSARDKHKKIDNIEKNYSDIKKHSDEIHQLQESDKQVIEKLGKVEKDVKSLTEVTELVAAGVKVLLGEKLGYVNNKKQEEEIYENFLKRERVI